MPTCLPCAPCTQFLHRSRRHEYVDCPTTGHLRVALLFLEDPLIPVNPIVEALVCRLDMNLREVFEERAGIQQFEAGRERELAEALALLDVIRLHPLAVSGLVVLRGSLAGAAVVVLGTDQPAALALLDALGATVVAAGDLSMALHHLGGLARLTALPAPSKK
jgi:hypothetical protein